MSDAQQAIDAENMAFQALRTDAVETTPAAQADALEAWKALAGQDSDEAEWVEKREAWEASVLREKAAWAKYAEEAERRTAAALKAADLESEGEGA